MEVVHENGPKRGAFEVKDGNKTVAEMTYVWSSDDNIIIDHTEVSPTYQGQGLGKSMVEKAVEYARQNDLTILPLCSFARTVFNRNTSYNDVRKF